ncbi:MAG: hypothetical protein K2N13_05330 [Paraprevotella sp.]|nr:hypothetical protein [Paraprevotella sp.]
MIRPERYILQPRHLEKGSKFRNYLYEHIFMGANVGVSKVDPRGGRNLAPGIPLSLFVGNYFNRLHGVRLTATFQRYGVSENSRDIKQAGADLDYMFNLTSYLDGYNPARVFSLSGTIGIGVISSHLMGWKAPVYKGQAGVHAAFHIRRTAEMFVEPFFAFTTDQLDHSGARGNAENYDLQYGVKAGLSVRFGQEKEFLKGTTHNGNLFFEATQGLTFYNSNTLAVRKTTGTGYALSVGKWFDPLVGLRITGHASDYLWGSLFIAPTESRPTYEEHRRAALFAGRGEVLINPMHFAKRAREVHRPFDLNIAVGGEVGRIVKYISGYEHGMKCNYVGFTAALQGLYNLNTNTSLFIEPRFLTAQYVIPYSNIPAEKAYNDQVFLLNAGVRFIRPTKEERKIRGLHDFEPGCFANIQLGGLKQVMNVKRIGERSLNYSGSLQFGYEPFAFGGVKIGVEYMALNRHADTQYEVDWEGFKRQYESQWHYTYGLLNTKMQLMLNLLNIYQGYDPERKLAVYLNFGPAYSLCLNQQNELYERELQVGTNPISFAKNIEGDGAWALNGSMVVDYRLAPRWSLYVEPEIQYFLKDNFIGRGVFADMKSLLVKFNIGASFHF